MEADFSHDCLNYQQKGDPFSFFFFSFSFDRDILLYEYFSRIWIVHIYIYT